MNETPENPSPDDAAPDTASADNTTPESATPQAAEPQGATPDSSASAETRAVARPAAPPAPVYTNGQHTPPAPTAPTAEAPTTPASLAVQPPTLAAPATPIAAPTTPIASTVPPLAPHLAVPAQGATKTEKGASFKRAPVGVIAALAIGALVGGVSGAGVAYFALANNGSGNTQAQTIPANITVNDPDNATTVTAVAASAGASVVTISAAGTDASGTGSGVLISKDGYILTNTHVVTLEGATADAKVSVRMSDGRLFDATIVGTDPIVDLAVIKIDGVTDLKPIEFADSGALNVGDTAIAIGAPLGLNNTVTNGIVSALNRSITIASSAVPEGTEGEEAPDDSGDNPFDFWQFDTPGQNSTQSNASSTISLSVIQTDAAINPGNSGGALLDSTGKLIGINVAIASAGDSSGASGNIGVGFAVPANLAKRVADEIIANGSATHGLLGASVLDVTEDADIADSAVVGASVKEIVPGGAAEAAGLKVGDVITGIDGLPITGKTDLTAQVRSHAGGSEATVTYVRNGKTSTADVTLGTL
jgi:putative serine protease PepD